MRLRQGFVSNSSSSSFIIARDPGDTKIEIHFTLDLQNYTAIKSLDKLENLHKDDEWEFSVINYEAIKKAILDGKIIYVGRYEDEITTNGIDFPQHAVDTILSLDKGIIFVGRRN